MKKLKLFFACLLMAVLSIGQVWGAVYFEDTFSDVGTGSSGSMLPRDGWSGSGTTAPQYNTGVRLGASSSGATLTKAAMSNIEGTKSLKVTIYVSRYNTNANTLTVTATNGTIASATLAENVSTGSGLTDGTLTIKPSANAGVTSTTAAATWTDAYKTEFTITGASSSTTIAFASDKRLILGPVKIEDAASTPSTCTSEITITKADNPENGTFAIDNSGTVCIDEGNATVTVTATPAAHYHLASVTSTVGTIGSIAGNTCEITDINADTEIGVAFAENDKYQVIWNVNGNEDTKTNVYAGEKPVFPATPESCDATSTTFIGWAAAPWTGKLADLSEKTVYTSASAMPDVDAAVTYYAVFAKAGGSASELFSWAGGTKAGLTAAEGVAALTADNSDYAESHAPYRVKWNTDKMYIIISVASQPGKVSAGFKKIGGAGVSTITVQESTATDGTFTDVETLSIEGASNAIVSVETSSPFQSTTRAIKLVYNKQANVGLGPISIEGAVSYEDYMTTCTTPTVAKPTISGETSFLNSTEVTLAQAAADAIYYTIDNSTPTDASTPYSAPFTLTNSATVKAIAVKGGVSSAVAEETFTKVTVLTVAEARAAIDAGGDLSNKYVAGIISQIDSYNGTYHSITYWISDDGTTEDQLEVYGGLAGVVKTQFASKDDLAVGDDVTVNGTLKKYNSIYEFDKDNIVVAYKPIARLAWAGTTEGAYNASLEGENTFPTLTNTNSVTVAYSSSDESAATINPSTGAISLVGVGTTTITASFAGNETYKANSVSYTLNVASSVVHATISFNVDGGDAIADLTDRSALPMELPVATKAGKNFGGWFTDSDKEFAAVPGAAITENTTLYAKWLEPYTVAEAKAVIDANASGIANQYVAGIISQIDSYQSSYHSITYWISADGTTTNQLQVYSGLIGNAATALEKEQFTAKTDLELGDEVVVTGTLKLHNSTTYEFDKNNTIYTFSRKASAGLEWSESSFDAYLDAENTFPSLTNPYSLAVTYSSSETDYATISNEEGHEGEITLKAEGSTVITASFAGDATYKAAEVSYTLNIGETAPEVDTRKVAESPEGGFSSISDNLSGGEISFAAYQGGSQTPPNGNNAAHELRLYKYQATTQYGGYVTITAKTGCTIDQVVITVSGNCNVGWCKDAEALPTKEDTPIAIGTSTAFDTGTGLDASSVSVVNLDESNQFKIKTITVYYNGDGIDLQTLAISGTAAVLEYTDGQDFNPAGLVVTGHYSDNSDAEIADGITWAFDPSPLTEGTTSVSVTATVGEITSPAFVVNDLNVGAAVAPVETTDNVVILATLGTKLYAMSTTNSSNAFAAIEVEEDGLNIVVPSAEAKAAIQWTRIFNGATATFQDADTKYLTATNGSTNLNLGEDECVWKWYASKYAFCIENEDETKLRSFLYYNSSNSFKNYALSNAGGNYSGVAEVRVIAAENIVISSKVDPELAYTPASDEITVGDDWSAPVLGYVEGFDGLEVISYESSNEAVATVSDAGVIALAGGTGTAVITASFAGNANYLLGSATYTIKVNEVPDNCDATDDFSTANSSSPTSYTTRTTAAGWGATNAGYKVINDASYLMINGKTTAVGVITSPVLSDGIASLKFRYANTNNESNGVSVRIDIKQGTEVVKTYTLTKANSEVTKDVVYTEIIENINVAGEFQIIFTNLSPSNNTGNADRVSIGRLCWKNYSSTPEPVYTTVRTGLEAGRHYTVCLKNNVTAVKGATFWSLTYKNAAGTEAYLVQETEIEAGKPYIFQATNDNDGKLEVVYGEDVASEAGTNGALVGTFDYMDAVALAAVEGTVYMLFNNELRPIGTNNHLDAYRAYVLYNLLQLVPAAGFAPGKRVKGMPLHQDAATGFENINASEKPMKLMIDGNIYILRGEKMYDATGRLVK